MIERTFHVGGLTSMKKVFAKNATDQNMFLIFIFYIRDILNGIFATHSMFHL